MSLGKGGSTGNLVFQGTAVFSGIGTPHINKLRDLPCLNHSVVSVILHLVFKWFRELLSNFMLKAEWILWTIFWLSLWFRSSAHNFQLLCALNDCVPLCLHTSLDFHEQPTSWGQRSYLWLGSAPFCLHLQLYHVSLGQGKTILYSLNGDAVVIILWNNKSISSVEKYLLWKQKKPGFTSNCPN